MRQEQLDKKRREAVNLRLQGRKLADITAETGLSAPTIITAHKMFKEGGWDAVDGRPRGRSQGKNQRLSGKQLTILSDLVLSPPPELSPCITKSVTKSVAKSVAKSRATNMAKNHDGPGLWTLVSLEQYLKDHTDFKISSRTLNRYLTDLGLHTENQLKLARDNEAFNRWFEDDYPALAASAKSASATVLWTHYAAHNSGTDSNNANTQHTDTKIYNQTDTKMSTAHASTALIYTHTPRGKCCWLAGSYADPIQHLADFATRANRTTAGPVSLILSGLDVFSRADIKNRLTAIDATAIHPHPAFASTSMTPVTGSGGKQSNASVHMQRSAAITNPASAVSNTLDNTNNTPLDTAQPNSKQSTPPEELYNENPNRQTTSRLNQTSDDCLQSVPDKNNQHEAQQPITPSILSTPSVNTPRLSKRDNRIKTTMSLTHLQRLEAESIHIMREVVAEADNPVMLYSIGKDSAVMLHLAMKAFYPAKPPFPLLHVDTGWKFQAMYQFRDKMVKDLGLQLLTHMNAEGVEKGVNPFTHGSALHTDIMKTEALRQALDKHGFDAAFGGARRDEEKSRAKERIFSFRTAQHRWDPKNQRPELWNLYNARKLKGESIRAFPLSNWTELDIWQYIHLEGIPIVPLYLAAERPVVMRDGTLIMVDDDRIPMNPGEVPMMRRVRFRTLGCYPLTGAIESEASTLPEIIQEMLLANTSERQGRMIDHDSNASMEKKKQEGYF